MSNATSARNASAPATMVLRWASDQRSTGVYAARSARTTTVSVSLTRSGSSNEASTGVMVKVGRVCNS